MYCIQMKNSHHLDEGVLIYDTKLGLMITPTDNIHESYKDNMEHVVKSEHMYDLAHFVENLFEGNLDKFFKELPKYVGCKVESKEIGFYFKKNLPYWGCSIMEIPNY